MLKVLIAHHQKCKCPKAARIDISTPTAMMKHWLDYPLKSELGFDNQVKIVTAARRNGEEKDSIIATEVAVRERIPELYNFLGNDDLHPVIYPYILGGFMKVVEFQSPADTLAVLTFLSYYGVSFLVAEPEKLLSEKLASVARSPTSSSSSGDSPSAPPS